MSDTTFDELQKIHGDKGPAAAIDHLIGVLRDEKRFHQLFDALLMKKRLELGLGLVRPTSLKDVPEERRDEFEKVYIDTARHVGELLLADGSIPQAWHYFRAINEPAQVAAAIEALPEGGSVPEEVVEIALFQGIAPAKGLSLYLGSHGTCSTITAFDQVSMQMAPDVRRQCAQALVRRLYDDLRENVQHDVLRRQPMNPPGQPLRELIGGREWLFADDSYHIDVSHLNAVVRFARFLDAGCPELDQALQLAQYGSRLAQQYQYAGNPPFDDFYPAHIRFFKVLLDVERDPSLDYFRAKIGDDPAETDNQLAAYVVVDLLLRIGRKDEALELACKYLGDAGEEFGLSLPELCAQSGRLDLLKSLARSKGDVVNFAAALLGSSRP
ncbi:MAG: hypothetical protein HY290_06435 [Planctomycetia bacterium]|nr:hypothetical protein [Planctomycetia bacterium]